MSRAHPGPFLLHLHPADRAVAALLTLAVVVAWLRLPDGPRELMPLFLVQLGLLAGILCVTAWLIYRERSWWVQLVRPAVIVGVIFTLYSTLGRLGMLAMPYRADAALAHADQWLCGVDPSLFVEPYLTPARIEFFSFAYGAFIPYIYVTIALNCLGLPPLERDQFLTGWVFTYTISYLGYLFVPAQGPIIFDANEYRVALEGGVFYEMVLRGVAATGGLQGAFPSLHVGGSLYLCLFEMGSNRLRGLIYLPLVILIYLATIVLRYHYVVDLLAGTLIASVCLFVGKRTFASWARRRQDAGLPALPGGEGDTLPAVPPAGADRLETVLPAH